MTARKGTGGAAKPPPLQDRPAAKAQPKAPGLPPNPVAAVRAGREEPVDRLYQVVGPKAVGGVLCPDAVTLCLTDGQAAALEAGGHVRPITEDDLEPADDPALCEDPDQPMTGTDKEGS